MAGAMSDLEYDLIFVGVISEGRRLRQTQRDTYFQAHRSALLVGLDGSFKLAESALSITIR